MRFQAAGQTVLQLLPAALFSSSPEKQQQIIHLGADTGKHSQQSSYCLPGQPCFPSADKLQAFNASIGGKLERPSQPALPCYSGPSFDAGECEQATKQFTDPFWRADQPGGYMYTNWNGNGNVSTCPLPGANSSLTADACGQGRAPAYLVAATSARDVSKAVRFAARYNLRLRIKNTGHDYLGRSGAEGSFTISTHLLKDAEVVRGWKPDCKKYKHSCRHAVPQDAIVAGPALYVEDLYTKAKENNVVIPGGVSRTVGATGGWALGGGHGPLGRLYGMGVDNVLQYTVVTADGRTRVVNRFEEEDLFWALLGGGGAFGVVTEVVMKVHPALKGMVGVFGTTTLSSPSTYPEFLAHWLRAHRNFDAANMTGYNFLVYPTSVYAHLLPIPHDAPGDLSDYVEKAKEAFADFSSWATSTPGVNFTMQVVQKDNWFDFWDGPFDKQIGSLDAVGLNLLVASRLIHKDVIYSDDKLANLSSTFSNVHSPLIAHFVAGGVISQVPTAATSINPAWRSALFLIEPVVEWSDKATPAAIAATQAYLTGVTASIGAVSGYSDQQAGYVNEADPNERDWQAVFWGKETYARLLEIKKKYDRHGVFSCYKCVGSEIHGS